MWPIFIVESASNGPDAGSWPDWIAAGVAGLAFIVAAVAAWATVGTNKKQADALAIQQRQIKRLEDGQKREQASKVAWWRDGDLVIIANFSTLPIYNARINLPLTESEDDSSYIPALDWLASDVVKPGEEFPFENGYTKKRYLDIAVSFHDASRNEWHIMPDGSLFDGTLMMEKYERQIQLANYLRLTRRNYNNLKLWDIGSRRALRNFRKKVVIEAEGLLDVEEGDVFYAYRTSNNPTDRYPDGTPTESD